MLEQGATAYREQPGLAPAVTLARAFVAAMAVTILLAATGGTRHVDADLIAYGVLAAVLGFGARWWTAGAGALILWLYYDGFLVGRHGELVWQGNIDAWRLGVITACAAGGLLVGRVCRFVDATASDR
ncbi:type IV secretory pathway TrbD component [Catenulispora sp. MAP12-49]|uniref:hypothetical protein n=1 Tax=Catenulispora sp. MAP12-49 TaxID=3156302 RepID=UPI0035156299